MNYITEVDVELTDPFYNSVLLSTTLLKLTNMAALHCFWLGECKFHIFERTRNSLIT